MTGPTTAKVANKMSKSFVCAPGARSGSCGAVVHAAFFGAAVALITLTWPVQSYAKTSAELEKEGYTCKASVDTVTCTKPDEPDWSCVPANAPCDLKKPALEKVGYTCKEYRGGGQWQCLKAGEPDYYCAMATSLCFVRPID
jgi:hypothetical protein